VLSKRPNGIAAVSVSKYYAVRLKLASKVEKLGNYPSLSVAIAIMTVLLMKQYNPEL